MKVVFFDVSDFENNVIEKFSLENSGISIKIYRDSANYIKDEDLDTDIISVFITSKVDDTLIQRFSGLKLILTRSTGFDHIDITLCGKKGIKVCNVPDYGSNTVAEFTFLLILSLFRKINFSEKSAVKFSRGSELLGKTIGIVGAGRIGLSVCRIANGFGMKILYYNRSVNENFEKMGAIKSDLNKLLSDSDIVTLHIPLITETFHLINKDNITLMKKTAFLVNTSRGGIIDTEAVVNALDSGSIAGVALDVIEGEEFSGREVEIIKKKENYDIIKNALETNILRNFDNAILTPHIAYNTDEALLRIINTTFENIMAQYKGNNLNNIIV